jgi:hypothetical protein
VAITATTVRLTKALRNSLLKVTDQQVRDLVAAWASAWDEVAGELEIAVLELAARAEDGRITRGQVLRSRRLASALDTIARRLTSLADQAGVRIVADLPAVVEAAGRAQAEIIDSQLPKAERGNLTDWSRVDSRQIDAIVTRSTEQIASDLWPLSSEAQGVIRRELVRGVAAGANPRETATRMLQRTQGGFNGGLTRALTIARTETLDAHRAAAKVSQEANADVLGGWVWLTDLRVSPPPCPACLGMAGTEHPLTEPGPLGHANCRCSRMPRTKTWAELGIEGMDEPESKTPDAADWFASLEVATQKKILGPARYAAWRRGEYPMSAWAERVSADGWRDSYRTSQPKPSSSDLLAS